MKTNPLSIRTSLVDIDKIIIVLLSFGGFYLYFHYPYISTLIISSSILMIGILSSERTSILIHKESFDITKGKLFNLVKYSKKSFNISEITAIKYQKFTYQHSLQSRVKLEFITKDNMFVYNGLFSIDNLNNLTSRLTEINPNIHVIK